MKSVFDDRMRGLIATGCALGILWLAQGCALPEPSDVVIGRKYKPANVFTVAAASTAQIRRVAVLPLHTQETSGTEGAGAEALQPIYQAELLKTHRYEFVWVTKDYLWQTTGRRTWASDEKLPEHFLEKLRQDYGCDAVLFGRVTRYRPYPPLTIGWRLQLVGVAEPFLIWAADEIFDLSQKQVSNGARRFEQKRQAAANKPIDSHTIFYSADAFGQYTAQVILSTLPGR